MPKMPKQNKNGNISKKQKKIRRRKVDPEKSKHYCSVCGREIPKDEYDGYDGICWECWDDRLTEESDSMFDDVL